MRQSLYILIFQCLVLSFAQAQEIDEILEKEEQQQEIADEKVENLNIKSVSGLEKLVPFNDIAMIQRKYLPRTGRFEFFPNLGLILNDAFFTNYLAGGKFAYHFTEKWGLEASYIFASDSEKDIVKDLQSNSVETSSIVIPESYLGIDLKWVPIYGKMASLNKNIISFDLYFSFGVASLDTNQDDSPIALHLGVGQSFAINKYVALRWDTSFYWYNSEVEVQNTKEEGSYMNLHLTVGASFFFPEAKYR